MKRITTFLDEMNDSREETMQDDTAAFRTEIANAFISEYAPIYIRRTLWIYNGEVGNYRVCNVDYANAIIERLIGEHAKNSVSLCKEVLAQVHRRSYCDDELGFNRNPYLVNFTNGVLNLKNGHLMEHDPANAFSYCLRAKYRPLKEKKLKNSRFYQFVSQMCDGNQEKYLLLQEMCGVLLSDIKIKGSIFFIGEHDTGKSVLGNLLSAAVGCENCSSLALSEFRSEFLLSQMYQKKINISGETQKAVSAKDWRIFKTITGGDTLMLNAKFQQPVSVKIGAKILFIGNFLPTFPEDDPALLDRCNVVYFNNIVDRQQRDPNLLETLLKELRIFIRWSMEGAMRYQQQGGFSHCTESDRFFTAHVQKCDSTNWFIAENLQVGEVDDIISTQELYNSYKMFCEDHNAPIQTQEHFLDTIDRAFPAAKRTRIRIGTSRPRVYKGLCYKNTMEVEYETI